MPIFFVLNMDALRFKNPNCSSLLHKEQQNLRLRKALAALKSQLFGSGRLDCGNWFCLRMAGIYPQSVSFVLKHEILGYPIFRQSYVIT
jgi:hypothetical protein